METKLSKLKAAAARGDWREALRIAARFRDLGEHRAAIVRAHEASENGRFYAQVGKDPAELIRAGIEALKARYALEGEPNMQIETSLPSKTIAQGTAILTGGGFKRAADRAAYIGRFLNAAEQVARLPQSEAAALLALAETEFLAACRKVLAAPEARVAVAPVAAEPETVDLPAIPLLGGKLAAIEPVAPKAPVAAPKADAKAPRGAWAARTEAAERGELPEPLDFSKPTHARGRKRLAAVLEAAQAGDVEALRAIEIPRTGDTLTSLARFRDLCVRAIEVRAAR